MKFFLGVTLLVVMLSGSYAESKSSTIATCSGGGNCNACKNCKYCKHCSKDGGTCSVCN